MTDEQQKLTITERYSSAINASNLRVEAGRNGQIDYIMAMAWSPSRVGSALMRLHSEWDGASKPHRITQEAVNQFAATLTGTKEEKTAKAQRIAQDWHLHECALLLGKLKSLPSARAQLEIWARRQHIADAEWRVAEILLWWLSHVCPVCSGRGKEIIRDTPSLSHRDCRACHGTGETQIPHQPGDAYYLAESKKILRYISDCVMTTQSSAKQWLKARL